MASSSFTSVNSAIYSNENSSKRKKSAPNKENEEGCLWSCLISCLFFTMCVLIVSFFLAFAVYLVYTIMALAETGNNDIKEKCPDNNSWYCVILVLILGTIVNSNKVKSEVEEKDESQSLMTQLCGFCCWATINIILIVWLNNNVNDSCFDENFKDTKLWIVANIQFWLFSILTLFIGLVLVMTSCIVTYELFSKSKLNSDTNYNNNV